MRHIRQGVYKVSLYVLHRFEGTERVARIQLSVLVSKSGVQPLRLAVGLLLCFAALTGRWQGVCGEHYRSRQQNVALPIEDITALLVSAQPIRPAYNPSPKKRYYYVGQLGKMFYARHWHMSRTVDQRLA